jgi:hypothetical protein
MAKSKKCESLKFAADTANDVICKAAKAEWKRRYVNKDGSPKANRWAPIYILRGDTEKLSFRLDGDRLILSGEIAYIAAFKKKTTYV